MKIRKEENTSRVHVVIFFQLRKLQAVMLTTSMRCCLASIHRGVILYLSSLSRKTTTVTRFCLEFNASERMAQQHRIRAVARSASTTTR